MKHFLVAAVFALMCSALKAESDVICTKLNEGMFFPDYDDCSNYYLCHKGALVVGSCMAGLNFNFEAQSCEVNNSSCLACPGTGIVHVRHYHSCKKYYFCTGKEKTLMQCPSGLYFNRHTGNCDFASAAECEERCPKHTPEPIFTSYKGSCRKYKICYEGEEKLLECAKGLYFNPSTNNCDVNKNLECFDDDENNPPISVNKSTSKAPATTKSSAKVPPVAPKGKNMG